MNTSRVSLYGLATFTLFAIALVANGQDPAARQKIAAQKLEAQVKSVIADSRTQDPVDASFALKKMVRQVQGSEDILESQRSQLLQSLNARIRVVDEAARGKRIIDDQRAPPRDPDRPKYTKPSADPSGGVGGAAKGFIDSAKNASNIQREMIQKREKGKLAIDLGAEKVVLTDKEYEFPPYWKQLSKEREKLVGQQLTKKEVALLKTLNSVLSVDYDGTEFKGVINHLQDKTGLTILIDEASLQETNTDYKDPVNFKIEKASVRFILKKVLGDKGLTYIIKEGSIQVMTPKKASEHTVVRTYQVDDLVAPSPQMQMMFGPFVAQAQMLQNAQMLINLIQSTVAPGYWQPDGPGSITFFPPTKSLIIRGSAEMHYQMQAPGLFGGR